VIVLIESTCPTLPFCHTFSLAEHSEPTGLEAPIACCAFPIPELPDVNDGEDEAYVEPLIAHGSEVAVGMRVAFIRKTDGKVATIKSPGMNWDAEDTSMFDWDMFSYRIQGCRNGSLLEKVAGHLPRPHNSLKHIEISMCVLEGAIGLGWGSFSSDEYQPNGEQWGSEEPLQFESIESPLGSDVLDALEWR
jgi:hypothetical protein